MARGQAVGADEYGLVDYTFDPIVDSAGKTYVFRVSCVACDEEKPPTLFSGPSREGAGNFIRGDRIFTDRVTAFAPIHDRLPPADTPRTVAQATRLGPGDWRIETDGPQTALLVVGETWFPGWKATVDGRRVPAYEADGAFVGVPLTAGKHVVTLQYERPASALLGRFITFGMLMGIVWIALRQRRRPFGHRARRYAGSTAATGSKQGAGSGPGRSRHTFQMRTPPVEPGGEGALGPEKGGPGPPVADGKGHAANDSRLCCRWSTTSSPASSSRPRSVAARNREWTPTPSQWGWARRPRRMAGLSSTVSASTRCPPGVSTLRTSASTTSGSGRWCRTWIDSTRSIEPVRNGSRAASPAAVGACRRASTARAGSYSRPTGASPAAAIRRSQKPLPQPRSRALTAPSDPGRPSAPSRKSRPSNHGLRVSPLSRPARLPGPGVLA